MAKSKYFKGVQKFNGKLSLFQTKSKSELRKSLEKTLIQIAIDTRNITPVGETGFLKAHTTYEMHRTKIEGYVMNDMIYAPYVEFGTDYQAAQPYLTPSVEKNIGFWNAEMKRAMYTAGKSFR